MPAAIWSMCAGAGCAWNCRTSLKRLDRERGRAVLKPENKAYLPARCAQAGPVIRPKGELEIFGVVVGQFRKRER